MKEGRKQVCVCIDEDAGQERNKVILQIAGATQEDAQK